MLKRISVASGARIYVPPEADAADNAVTLEGTLQVARAALSGLVEALLPAAIRSTQDHFDIPGADDRAPIWAGMAGGLLPRCVASYTCLACTCLTCLSGSSIGGVVGQKGQHLKAIVSATNVHVSEA